MNYHDHHGKKPPMKTAAPQTLTAENHWRYQRETEASSADFYGHVWGCFACFPWRGQYCKTGERLRLGYVNASKTVYERILAAQNDKQL